MKPQRALFFCGHDSRYGLAHLEPILESPLEVVAVVLADARRWSLFRQSLNGGPMFSPRLTLRAGIHELTISSYLWFRHFRKKAYVEKLCAEKSIPVWCLHDANHRDSLERVRKQRIDWLLSAAFPQIFKADLLDIPTRGCINFHPSLLPQFRGAHPHFWAVATGAKETGLTAHLMTERIDDGDVVASVPFSIDGLTYEQVYDKIVSETPRFVQKVAEICRSGNPAAIAQDASKATYFRNDREIHRRIFWDQLTAEEITNLVRTGAAYCFLQRERIGILDAYPSKSNRNLTNGVKVSPGAIVDVSEATVVVKARDGCINIRRLAYRRRPCRPDKWVSKLNVRIGEYLC